MASKSTPVTRMRDQVFISYSHKDTAWMEKFSAQLNVIKQTGRLDIWSDKSIRSGQNWVQEINAAIARARVALLLVTVDFLTSEFIKSKELPKILKGHQNDGLYLYWVPIGHAPYSMSDFANIQAAHDPKRPLRGLEEVEQDRVISDIATQIGQMLGQAVRMPGDSRQHLKEHVRQQLQKSRYDFEVLEEIGSGDTSIVYKGQQGMREYAVKVLVSGSVSSGERDNLEELLRKAARLTDPAFIRIHDEVLEGEPICIVGEYVTGRTLTHVLHQRPNHRLPPDEVILYVRQLARALNEAHEQGLSRLRLLPSNLYLDSSRIRLSPLVLSLQSNRTSREYGALYMTKEAINYMPPEQYYGLPLHYGLPLQKKTDQYALGLVALSMLQGAPPVPIRQLADLAQLPSFFDNPRKFFDKTWVDQAPGLSRVIARMLCKDPQDRWDSMDAILNAVEPLQRSRHRQEGSHVGDAKQSYCRYCRGRPEFYRAFYAMFFRRSPGTERLFAKVSMERQYDMIDEAIEKLLNFREGAEPTTLSRTREVHRRLQLAPVDFDHFRDAFLEALEAMGERDQEVLDSWYAVLRPGVDYMAQVCSQKSQRKPVPAPKPSSEVDGATLSRRPLAHASKARLKAHR
jgi:serine/threonine protein kinase